MQTTITLDEITKAICDEAQNRWAYSNLDQHFYSLILRESGELFWTVAADEITIPESVFNGEATRLICVKGQPWNGDDFDAFEMIEVTDPALLSALEEEERSPVQLGNETYHRGKRDHGYDPAKWYLVGELLSFADANPNISAEEHMADAIDAAQEFLSK